MKRRPLLLAVVLTVAAVACIAPFWWEIWLMVAYERRIATEGLLCFTRKGVEESTLGPEDIYIPPGQLCGDCRVDEHCRENSLCQPHEMTLVREKGGRKFSFGVNYSGNCSCPTCHPERGE